MNLGAFMNPEFPIFLQFIIIFVQRYNKILRNCKKW